MTVHILKTNIYSIGQKKYIEKNIKNLFEDLNVNFTIDKSINKKWIQITLNGEDEEIAKNLLESEIGFCPENLEKAKVNTPIIGYVTNIEPDKEKILVDIGIFQPKQLFAQIHLEDLKNNLEYNKDIKLERISKHWGFTENLPIEVKIIEIKPEMELIKAELSINQIKKYRSWRKSLLDRLIIIGASLEELKETINNTYLDRDIIEIEQLGMFEHALVCKLGTDAMGLIPIIARKLRRKKFMVFNPKIINFSE